MSVHRNGRYYIGSISFVQPEIMAHVENGVPNHISCFLIDHYEVDFEVNIEVCYSRENAEKSMIETYYDYGLEPLGEVTSVSLNGYHGYYLDYLIKEYHTFRREFSFDLPDPFYNFLSITVITQSKDELDRALQCDIFKKLLESIQFEA